MGEEAATSRRRLSLKVQVCLVSFSFSILRSTSEALKEWKVWVAIVECVLDGWIGCCRKEEGSADIWRSGYLEWMKVNYRQRLLCLDL